jgi:DNA (cytosine-5)-methyltransferase 1
MNSLNSKISLSEQEGILSDCLKRELSLAFGLKQKGLTYDSLRYREYPDVEKCKENTEFLDGKKKLAATIPAVSFFSGAGGLNIGFEYAGFDNIASIEFNEIFCNTLRYNNPHKTIIGPPGNDGDVREHELLASLLESAIGTTKEVVKNKVDKFGAGFFFG